MENIVLNEEIEYTRENAKARFNEGNYPLAKNMLEKLWEDSKKNDAYLLFDYGKALRKTNESMKFVEICRQLNSNKKIMANKWIVSTLCWCLYECYIKDYSIEVKDGFGDYIKKAEFIKDNCHQMNADEHYKTPYVMTIRKVVKAYNERASINFKEVIKWLSYLDPERLSEEEFKFQDETGRDRELASPKEFYYQHMDKALEKSEKYEDCILICETAFKQISKFHYRNNTWIKARLYFSKCMVHEEIESAIAEYKELAYKENYWFMYHKLSQICFRYNRIPEALLYVSKAYGGRFEHEKMVNLFLDTALLWQATGNNENAKLFFQASAYYRNRQTWSIPEELQFAINALEINIEEKPNIKILQNISKYHVATLEDKDNKLEGEVDNILPHGGAGFIKPTDGSSNIYFNMNDVFGKKVLMKGDKVVYEITKGKDNKLRAVKITIGG